MDDLHRALDSLRQVEAWMTAAMNLPVDREFIGSGGPVTVEITGVKDAYDVYPADFVIRSAQHLATTLWWDQSTTTNPVNPAGGSSGTWEGQWCTAVALNQSSISPNLLEDVLDKGKRYVGFVIGVWDVTGYAKNGYPVVAVMAEEKMHYKITGYNSGADLYSASRCTASGGAFTPSHSLVYRIQRFPSNLPSPPGGTGIPPLIPNDQVVEVKLDPDRYSYYYIVGACGGLQAIAMHNQACDEGYLVGRDLKFTVTSPPPPVVPPVPAWYCVNGDPVYAVSDPPHVFDCGPFTAKPDCAVICPTSYPATGLGITDSTAYADPYTVGNTISVTLAKTGGSGGPYIWFIGAMDPNTGEVTTSEIHTGTTFNPTIKFNGTGTVEFLVALSDDSAPTELFTTVISRTVNPAVTPIRTGAGNLEDDDAYRLTKANTPGGGFTLTLNISALGRARMSWPIKNVGTGVLTINQVSGETINGAASITVAAGASTVLWPDNLSTWATGP